MFCASQDTYSLFTPSSTQPFTKGTRLYEQDGKLRLEMLRLFQERTSTSPPCLAMLDATSPKGKRAFPNRTGISGQKTPKE